MSSKLDLVRNAGRIEIERINEIIRKLDEEEKILQMEEQSLNMKTNSIGLSGRITIDVGGRKFHTTVAALRAKNGFFEGNI